jgi:antitoxin component YwqK of YwqJK toxin-antitoxin module
MHKIFNKNNTPSHKKKSKLFDCNTISTSKVKKIVDDTRRCGKTVRRSPRSYIPLPKAIESTSTLVTTKYVNGESEATYKNISKDNFVLEVGGYKNGNKDGTWKSYHKNGEILSVIDYTNGEYDGMYTFYHENGTSWINRIYDKGVKHGNCYEDNRFGISIFRGRYIKGKPIGIHKYYNAKGDLVLEKCYASDGELLKTQRHHIASGGLTFENIVLDILS